MEALRVATKIGLYHPLTTAYAAAGRSRDGLAFSL